MSKPKTSAAKRFLASLLAVVMLLGMIPSTVFAVDAENAITLTVTSNGEEPVPVANATVRYTVTAGETEGNAQTVTTDESGVAAIDLTSYAEQIGTETVKVSYTVTADGYEAASATVEVTELGKNYSVTLTAVETEEPEVETVTLTVTKVGNGKGTVKVNGTEVTGETVEVVKGEIVEIEVAAENDETIVKYLKVNGEEVDLPENEPYKVSFSEDAAIEVKFLTDYNVTVVATPENGGDVSPNGVIPVKVGESVKLEVTAKENYKIAGVMVGNTPVEVDNTKTMIVTVSEEQDVTVSVMFARTYTVTVKCGENGTVTVAGETVEKEGSVVITESEDGFEIKAEPHEGYRVSDVKINGKEEKVESTNDETFSKTLDADKDYTVEVTFAPNVYTITTTANSTEESDGGTVTATPAQVEHGGKTTVAIKPDIGYEIASVKVNGETQNVTNAAGFSFDLENITEDKEVVVTFKLKTYTVTVTTANKGGKAYINPNNFSTTETVEHNSNVTIWIAPDADYNVGTVVAKNVATGQNESLTPQDDAEGNLFVQVKNVQNNVEVTVSFKEAETTEVIAVDFSDNYVRRDGNVYVYPKDATATLKPASNIYSRIVLYKNSTPYKGGRTGSSSISFINEDIEISGNPYKIYLKESRGLGGWVAVTTKTPIKILFDDIKPTVLSINNSTDTELYCNGNVDLPVDVTDKPQGEKVEQEKYSGIAKVEYCVIMPGDTEEQWQEMDLEKMTIPVSTEEDYVKGIIKVQATDKAGNKSDVVTRDLTINKIPPTITLDSITAERLSVEVNPFEADHSYSKVTATVTVTDNTLNDKGFEENEGVTVVGPYTVVNEEDGTSQTKFDLTFANDGIYNLNRVIYTSKSGSEITLSEDKPFGIDHEAPEGKVYTDKVAFDKFFDTLTFGVFKTDRVNVVIEASDAISAFTTKYYVHHGASALGQKDLEELNFEELTLNSEGKGTVTVSEENRHTVYFRLEDEVGNVCYLRSDGVIIDNQKLKVDFVPEDANENGIYGITNKDKVTVNVTVKENLLSEEDTYSGIKSVKYWIVDNVADDAETPTAAPEDAAILYSFEVENPAYNQLTKDYTGRIDVNKVAHNNCRVMVYVEATDNAGNVTVAGQELDIDVTAPVVSVEYADSNGTKTATVRIIERDHHFDADAATAAIQITAKNANGEDVAIDLANMISVWTTTYGETPDQDVHTATVTFSKDANYTFNVQYTDKAGNESNAIEEYFTIDVTAPVGEVSIDEVPFTKAFDVLTFGVFKHDKVKVAIEASDATSAFTTQYYIHHGDTALSETDLDSLYEADNPRWPGGSGNTSKNFSDLTLTNGMGSVTVEDENRHTVYFRLVDTAGNKTYVRSDGVIIDKTKLKVDFAPEAANEKGIYGITEKDTVTVNVTVNEQLLNDKDTYSGIKSVKYWIVDNVPDNAEMPEAAPEDAAILYSFEVENPAYNQLTKDYTGPIDVYKAAHNNCRVMVYVEATDNAGNVTVAGQGLDIDVTAPEVEVTYNKCDEKPGAEEGYHSHDRVATITITERDHHFDADAATAAIQITAKDANGEDVAIDLANMISVWTTTYGETPDQDVHTATVTFSEDANYTFAIKYTDKAGNESNVIEESFTVDKTAPYGSVTAKSGEGYEKAWTKLIEDDEFTFGFWSATQIDVNGTSDDATSPVKSVKYYKYDGSSALSETQLNNVREWTDFSPLTLKPNGQVTVYLKIMDKAGNVTYISTNGMILDDKAPDAERIAPEITVTPEQPVNGIYNRDVKIAVSVIDPEVGGTFAGLKTIDYQVTNMGTVTQRGNLYTFSDDPTKENLRQSWAKDVAITVDSAKNNSNDVKVIITAYDNADNKSVEEISLKIDITKPSINVSYNNNAPDSGSFYKNDRTATVTISERNFNADDVKVTITNTDGVVPKLSGWTKHEGTGNLDNTTYTATISYTADGDYTFAIAYTDLANNACPGETYSAGTTNPTEFTIDKTAPVVNVTYDNNSAANEKYFNAVRTATVTIIEHNFAQDRVHINMTAGRGGVVPNVSWTHSGDRHIATIPFTTDGDYTFDINVQDKAGNANNGVNYGGSVAPTNFVVDTTYEDMITYTGVTNGTAYGKDKEVVPEIKIEDINLDTYEVRLVGVQKGTTNDLTAKANSLLKNSDTLVTGILDIFKMVQDMDGIYTLTMKAMDKAGNTDEEEVVFTVNRFGSVYVYSDYLMSLIADGGAYVPSITDNLEITEYNADKLVGGSLKIEITCDGKPLENVIYTVSPEINNKVIVGESGWYQYKYVISADNFTSDGVYKISVSSKDATGNTPENNSYEDMGIVFRVDSTQSEITSVVGLEDAIINATAVEVKYTVFDALGIKSVKIYVDGELVDEITDFSADLNNYTGSFMLNEKSSAQSVRIVVEDLSGNITDTDAEDFTSAYEFNRIVTVSTNLFVRWFANKPLFWGSIVGAAGLAAAFWFFLFGKRKKKEEEKATAK